VEGDDFDSLPKTEPEKIWLPEKAERENLLKQRKLFMLKQQREKMQAKFKDQ
jgi:hypothetical protein